MAGHVRRRGPSWELRVYAGRDPLTDRKRYRTRSFRGSREEAQAELQKFMAEVTPFGALLDAWLEEHPGQPEARRAAETYLTPLRPLPPAQVATLVGLINDVLGQP